MDDDPYLLEGLSRVLGFDFEVTTEGSAETALRRLEDDSGFQVVLSDLKMPGIDGTRFLAETKRILPSATRLLLTGVPDLEAAIAAINEGGVFRFLTKPCCSNQLLGAVHAAVQQHRQALSHLEREAHHGAGSAGAQAPLLEVPPAVSQTRRACTRPGTHLAILAQMADAALHEGRGRDAERLLDAPLRALLKNAQAGRPTDPDDTEMAAVLAARLAAATGDGTWIDYPFLLFCAIRRLLPSQAIDEVQKAFHRVRRVNPGALELYLSVMDLHGRARTPIERCLLKRVQQCRALLPLAV